ncbi:hypothetical protein AB0A77_13655 [Streptomyces varsoviensis]|uniref:alpha/beta fold hydrolase n=1 Tax=Streptomyces varsoviensis TaxID=67373 RepID=UPI0033EFC440
MEELRDEFRVVVPVLPIGSHRRPMRPDADLSARGVAMVLADFLDRLDLRDVTLVQNDAGTAQLLVGVRDERVGRLVLSSCGRWRTIRPASRASSSRWRAASPGASICCSSRSGCRSWRGRRSRWAGWRSGASRTRRCAAGTGRCSRAATSAGTSPSSAAAPLRARISTPRRSCGTSTGPRWSPGARRTA